MGAETGNYGTGCQNPCVRTGPERTFSVRTSLIQDDDGPMGWTNNPANQSNLGNNYRSGNALTAYIPYRQAISGCKPGDRDAPRARYWTTGNGPHSINSVLSNVGVTAFNNPLNHFLQFEEPVDWCLYPGSFQDGTNREKLIVSTRIDEFVRGAGANRLTVENMPNYNFYRDNSGAGTQMIFRNVTFVQFQTQGMNGLSAGVGMGILRGPDGYVGQRCSAFLASEGCTPATTPRWHIGYDQITAAPNFGQDFILDTVNSAWEYSSDFGVTWGPAPANVTHGPAAVGEHQWRTTLTVPPGYEGHWRAQVQESNTTEPNRLSGTLTLDGNPFGASNVPGNTNSPSYGDYSWHSDYAEVDNAGSTHTLLWAENLNNAQPALQVHPRIRINYDVVKPRPRQLQILDCLNQDGTIFNTRYYDVNGVETTHNSATHTLSFGAI